MHHDEAEVDLRFHMRLGVEHIFNSLDRHRGCLPFFSYRLAKKPIRLSHGRWDCPHVVGRFLDGLANCAQIIQIPEEPEAIAALTGLLHRSMENKPGLAWNEPTNRQVQGALTHNQREALLALTGLMTWRDCDKSAVLARRLCRSIEGIT